MPRAARTKRQGQKGSPHTSLPHPNLLKTTMWAPAQPLSWEVTVPVFQRRKLSL